MQHLRVASQSVEERQRRLTAQKANKEMRSAKLERTRYGGAHDDVELANALRGLGIDLFSVPRDQIFGLIPKIWEGRRIDEVPESAIPFLAENFNVTRVYDAENRPLVHFENPGEVKKIPLTNGGVTVISDSDYGRVSREEWYLDNHGYARRVRRPQIRLHKFLLGEPPKGKISDHENRVKLDNRRSNLRFITEDKNQWNKGKRSDNRSGFIGVSWHRISRMWRAQIRVGGKKVRLGRFHDPIEAAEAYDKAARKYRGEFAVLNFPTELSKEEESMKLHTQIAEISGQPRKVVKAVIEGLIKQIRRSLKEDRGIRIPEIGKLAVRYRPAKEKRRGRNPFTGKEMWFKAKPASNKLRFSPAKDLKRFVADKIAVVAPPKKKKKGKKGKKDKK